MGTLGLRSVSDNGKSTFYRAADISGGKKKEAERASQPMMRVRSFMRGRCPGVRYMREYPLLPRKIVMYPINDDHAAAQ